MPNHDPISFYKTKTFLIGINGWYDLRNCDNVLTHVGLHKNIADFELIASLRNCSKTLSAESLIWTIQSIADEEVKSLDLKLKKCLKQNAEKIVVATHVPPLTFGKESYPGFYSNKKLMDLLADFCFENSKIEVICLTGHNHTGGFQKIDNLTIYCKASRYHSPDINIIEV